MHDLLNSELTFDPSGDDFRERLAAALGAARAARTSDDWDDANDTMSYVLDGFLSGYMATLGAARDGIDELILELGMLELEDYPAQRQYRRELRRYLDHASFAVNALIQE
jgi:hypothetical protein